MAQTITALNTMLPIDTAAIAAGLREPSEVDSLVAGTVVASKRSDGSLHTATLHAVHVCGRIVHASHRAGHGGMT